MTLTPEKINIALVLALATVADRDAPGSWLLGIALGRMLEDGTDADTIRVIVDKALEARARANALI